MKQAGLGQWDAIKAPLEALIKERKVDAAPGKREPPLFRSVYREIRRYDVGRA
jgi:hypothetical protein